MKQRALRCRKAQSYTASTEFLEHAGPDLILEWKPLESYSNGLQVAMGSREEAQQ